MHFVATFHKLTIFLIKSYKIVAKTTDILHNDCCHLYLLYLPVYNAYQCIMHPDFEACFQKEKLSMLSLTTTNFLEKDSSNLKSSSTSMKFNYKT